MELRVSSYGSRADLEAYCENLTPEEKATCSITGTLEELARFQLSPTTTVHQISCVASDYLPPEVVDSPVPNRIKSDVGYGLNGNLIKPNE